MISHTKAPDRVWSIVLAGRRGYIPLLLVCVLLTSACAQPAVYRATFTDSLPPSPACQAGDCHGLGGRFDQNRLIQFGLFLA